MPKIFGEPFVLDTNILIKAHQTDHPHHPQAFSLVKQSIDGVFRASFAYQNLIEFTRVATDKRMMAEPFTPQQASVVVTRYSQSNVRLLEPKKETLTLFSKLLAHFPKLKDSKQVFDIYLAATMLSHDVTTILTENTKDFRDIPGITSINPFN